MVTLPTFPYSIGFFFLSRKFGLQRDASEYPDAGSKDGYAGLLTRGLLDLASWATKDGMTWKTL